MTKDTIALYTEDREPKSLGALSLYIGKYIEDIFYAVNDATDFNDLTDRLADIVFDVMEIDNVTPNSIRYRVVIEDKLHYLKIKVK